MNSHKGTVVSLWGRFNLYRHEKGDVPHRLTGWQAPPRSEVLGSSSKASQTRKRYTTLTLWRE